MSIKGVQDNTIDAAMISIGSKGMGGGAVTSIIGYMSSNGFAVLIGVLVTILGFLCSVYFQRRAHIRNREKWEMEKEQMKREEARKEELHQLKIQQLRKGFNDQES